MVDITQIVIYIIGLIFTACGVLITKYLVPWLSEKISAEKTTSLLRTVTELVLAAEQTYVGSGRGEEKKEYVMSMLNKMGITLDDDALSAYVEAAVKQMNDSVTASTSTKE